jgi:hypothetical protein
VGDSNSVACDAWAEAGDARLYFQREKVADLYSLEEESLSMSLSWYLGGSHSSRFVGLDSC